MTVLGAALGYAAHGWPVLPLLGPTRPVHKAGKRPWLEDWQHSASTDPDTIRGWWQARPDSNVGLLTGARSGLVVLDVDPGAGGLDSLRRLQVGRRLPRTLYARTGSGGWHLLYAHPGSPVPNSAGRLGPGLDVRGDGGQIVAAPSVHPATGHRPAVRLVRGLAGPARPAPRRPAAGCRAPPRRDVPRPGHGDQCRTAAAGPRPAGHRRPTRAGERAAALGGVPGR